MFRTLRRLDSFEPQRDGALLGYLRRSLLNRIRDQFRRASRRPPIDPMVNGMGERVPSNDESPLDVVIGQGVCHSQSSTANGTTPAIHLAVLVRAGPGSDPNDVFAP